VAVDAKNSASLSLGDPKGLDGFIGAVSASTCCSCILGALTILSLIVRQDLKHIDPGVSHNVSIAFMIMTSANLLVMTIVLEPVDDHLLLDISRRLVHNTLIISV
jgi:hypothetical protein